MLPCPQFSLNTISMRQRVVYRNTANTWILVKLPLCKSYYKHFSNNTITSRHSAGLLAAEVAAGSCRKKLVASRDLYATHNQLENQKEKKCGIVFAFFMLNSAKVLIF